MDTTTTTTANIDNRIEAALAAGATTGCALAPERAAQVLTVLLATAAKAAADAKHEVNRRKLGRQTKGELDAMLV